ncbi:anthranilate phosphoribosyltransferase [Wilcoxina mikolae CBS 423.85]|nr:anthranilate phosphoribosyltransferase [Wilcoxina mikolae CBS 423.85]
MADGSYSLLPLLKKISTNLPAVTADDITDAIARISQNQCSPVQAGALLTAMHYTGLDMKAEIIAGAAQAMRRAGLQIHRLQLHPLAAGDKKGTYEGGLVDIVGTGGDGHDTYNVSTTAAIVASGCGIRICKHGARASTSASGSADILTSLGASLVSITSPVVSSFYSAPGHPASSFCFLFAPVYHPAMAHIAPIRRDLGCRTIFNVLGPLINPVDYSHPSGLEARILGVGKHGLGPVYAETLRLLGVKKALVVCGEEQLDEISPEGYTNCWSLVGEEIQEFKIHPTETFGLPTHPLKEVAGGKGPAENAEILKRLLGGKMQVGEPIMDFVLGNAAALIAVSGAVEGESQVGADGVVRGTLWKNAVQRALYGIHSGESWRCWERFVEVSKEADAAQRPL